MIIFKVRPREFLVAVAPISSGRESITSATRGVQFIRHPLLNLDPPRPLQYIFFGSRKPPILLPSLQASLVMEPKLLADHKHHASLTVQQSTASGVAPHHQDPDTENVEAEKLIGTLTLKGTCAATLSAMSLRPPICRIPR
jgi:hypothetical protein